MISGNITIQIPTIMINRGKLLQTYHHMYKYICMRYLTLFCAVYVLRLQIEWSKRRLLINCSALIVGATSSVRLV